MSPRYSLRKKPPKSIDETLRKLPLLTSFFVPMCHCLFTRIFGRIIDLPDCEADDFTCLVICCFDHIAIRVVGRKSLQILVDDISNGFVATEIVRSEVLELRIVGCAPCIVVPDKGRKVSRW